MDVAPGEIIHMDENGGRRGSRGSSLVEVLWTASRNSRDRRRPPQHGGGPLPSAPELGAWSVRKEHQLSIS